VQKNVSIELIVQQGTWQLRALRTGPTMVCEGIETGEQMGPEITEKRNSDLVRLMK
jgi:hypothetical protein